MTFVTTLVVLGLFMLFCHQPLNEKSVTHVSAGLVPALKLTYSILNKTYVAVLPLIGAPACIWMAVIIK